MWGIHIFSESQDPGGSYVNVAGIVDQTTKVTGDYIYVPNWNLLFAVSTFFGATTPGYPYLESPSLRRFGRFDIAPVKDATSGTHATHNMNTLNNFLKLEVGEGLMCYDNSDPAAAEYHSLVLFMSDKVLSPINGEMSTIRFTSSITCSAGSWVSGNITLVTDLPVGNYNIVGMHLFGSNLIAGRLIFNNQVPRPGVMCYSSNVFKQPDMYRYGGLGSWGTFHSLTPPQLELYAIGANTSQVGFLDIMKA